MAVYKDKVRGTWYYKGKIKVNNKFKDYQKRGFETKKEALKAESKFINDFLSLIHI